MVFDVITDSAKWRKELRLLTSVLSSAEEERRNVERRTPNTEHRTPNFGQ
jgi:hypothetical protein